MFYVIKYFICCGSFHEHYDELLYICNFYGLFYQARAGNYFFGLYFTPLIPIQILHIITLCL